MLGATWLNVCLTLPIVLAITVNYLCGLLLIPGVILATYVDKLAEDRGMTAYPFSKELRMGNKQAAHEREIEYLNENTIKCRELRDEMKAHDQKHEAQQLDDKIERNRSRTSWLREQIKILDMEIRSEKGRKLMLDD